MPPRRLRGAIHQHFLVGGAHVHRRIAAPVPDAASTDAAGDAMTDVVREKYGAVARRNAAQAGVTNAELLKGKIERIPLPDASVDVIISNCVINLSRDKRRVLE